MSYMFGMCKEEWERLKSLQREYNLRKARILDLQLVKRCSGITEKLLDKDDDNISNS